MGLFFWAQNLGFWPKIPIFAIQPQFWSILAFGMAVNFPPWDPFFDFLLRSYCCFRKKIRLTRQKVFPPPTVGVPSASKSARAGLIIKLASWAHEKKQSSSRAQAKSETKGSRQKWTPPIPSTAPKSANPNCCKLNKFQIQNPRVVANSWTAQLSECFISTCCFSHPRSPKTGTDKRLGREVKRVFSSMFYIKGIRKEYMPRFPKILNN